LPRRILTSGLSSAMSCTLALRESRQRQSKIDKKVLVPLSVKEEEEKMVDKETYENDVITLKIPTSSKSTIISITSAYAQFLTLLIEARLSVSKEIMNFGSLGYNTLTHDDRQVQFQKIKNNLNKQVRGKRE
jgi:hypothetical protein